MEWTKDKPKKDGWYWYRHNPDKYPDLPPAVAAPLLLMVYDNASHYQDTVNDMFGSEIKPSMDGLWAGPIEPPPIATIAAMAASSSSD